MYSYKNEVLKPIAVRRNRLLNDGTPILASVFAITNRYLFLDVVEKRIRINGNKASNPDPYRWVFDRFSGAWIKFKDFENIDGISSNLLYARSMSNRLNRYDCDIPENYLIQGLDPELLVELYNDGKLSGKLQDLSSKLKFDDNPVLVIAKIRE